MPQIRDPHTSALIAEASDPRDLAIVADAVGLDRVVFDDVGPGFDVAATLELARAREADDADDAEGAAARHAALAGAVAEAVQEALDAGPDPEPVAVDASL